MKPHTLLIFALLLPLTAIAAPYQVVTIEDGDTLVVSGGKEQLRLQIRGIDAPEEIDNPKLKHDIKRTGLNAEKLLPLGEAATRHLRTMISAGDIITLESAPLERDHYGRAVSQIFNPKGLSLGQEMVTTGYAIVAKRAKLSQEQRAQLTRDEELAVKQNRGLWQSHPKEMTLWSGREAQP
ncbi:MAG: thermonuclease family protein [Gammaproteobacteria bacterium]|nr:thermonuclease family protein [Gammaproteobacteria bacterium]MCP4994858.1 thermonuclease family protein [Gammaproteobacteria bacterium]